MMDEEGIQSGSAFIWDAAGHLVTDRHVAQGTSTLGVPPATGAVVRGEIVGVTRNCDFAVIRRDASLPTGAGRARINRRDTDRVRSSSRPARYRCGTG